MIYNLGKGKDENFILAEDYFNKDNFRKYESIMCLGNGYLGLRNTNEEDYVSQVRGLYISGCFNRFHETEVTELPNCPDVIGMKIWLNEKEFDLTQFTILNYERTLNIRSGLATRIVEIKSKSQERFILKFKKFVSMDNLHLICQKVEILPLDDDVDFKLCTGIDGQVTNSSVQHFSEGDKRLFNDKIMQSCFKTTESKIDFVLNSSVKFNTEDYFSQIQMDRRKIFMNFKKKIKKGDTLIFEKFSTIHTSRDKENENLLLEDFKKKSKEELNEIIKYDFEELFLKSEDCFLKNIWNKSDIKIKSINSFDQFAVRFSIYHLHIMTPAHDSRMSIAAKGLSGEGYKGHVFWDTEIFCLPYFIYEHPEIARKLLEYRFNSLISARKKASSGGYLGAQYPWESAWIDDGEVTPVWGAADIITGKSTKIWSGFIEIHVTSDVVYAIEQYFKIARDLDFMKRYGYEIIFETALFWTSRLEYNENLDLYEINDVMGPDEYKEHVNNNAFTNQMAYYNMSLALKYFYKLKSNDEDTFKILENSINISSIAEKIEKIINKIYLQRPNKNLIIPQDDTYLNLKSIDLTPFKNQKHVGEIFKFYNLKQVNEIQVSKQADIMMMLYLLEDEFDYETIKANYDYYEPRTLHDSSLSLSTHCILAKKMNHMELAYELFHKSIKIDLGENMQSSNDGIHAASIGGIWRATILGFCGIKNIDEILEIDPRLPNEWDMIEFNLVFRGNSMNLLITKNTIAIVLYENKEVKIKIKDEIYTVNDEMKFKY